MRNHPLLPLPARERPGGIRLVEARGLRARLCGLAGVDEPPAGYALVIPRCRSVHTFGMRFPLDIVFLDRHGAVIRIASDVPPRRLVGCRRARTVIETPAGEAEQLLEALPLSRRPGLQPAAPCAGTA